MVFNYYNNHQQGRRNNINAIEKTKEEDVDGLMIRADTIIENRMNNIKKEIILMYYAIGKIITDYKKENESKHGESVVNQFVKRLQTKYGRGFDKSNIYYAIKFHMFFPNFPPAGNLGNNLSWSHIREIFNLSNLEEINYYIQETIHRKLTRNELRQSIKSKSFGRIIYHQRKDTIKHQIEKTLKDPLILNIENKKRNEKDLIKNK